MRVSNSSLDYLILCGWPTIRITDIVNATTKVKLRSQYNWLSSQVKVVKMLVVVVIIFTLSWLPLYAIFIRIKLGSETMESWEEILLSYVTPIAQWLGASNSCINPVLYAYFNQKYRRGFAAIVESRSCCGDIRTNTDYNAAFSDASVQLRLRKNLSVNSGRSLKPSRHWYTRSFLVSLFFFPCGWS